MTSSAARTIEDLPTRFNAAVDLIEHNLAAGRGDKPAFIDYRGSVSYAALADRVDRMAGVFRKLGIAREQRVILSLLDTVDFPTVFLGALKAGIVAIPVNTLLTPEDFQWILDDGNAAAVFVSNELADHWRGIAQARPNVRFISSQGGPWQDLEALIADSAPVHEAADTHRDDLAFLLYTSGSTGQPKGAMHVHGSMRLTANLFGTGTVGYREDDIVLSVAKLFFAYGLGNALTFPLAVGATTILHKDRPVPDAISALVREHRVSILNIVPTFLAGWFATGAAPTREEVPALRIATSAGEGLPAHLGEAFRDRYGADVIDGLGSTEMLHVYLSQQPGQVRYGFTGKPVPGYEVRIVDEQGEVLGPGELGELQVRGPTAATGYWRNRPRSIATFKGEWTRTGDTYSCDEDGWYAYGGRSDDMLKVGGIYVSPVEVEEALSCHPDVVEAAVIGAADGDGLIKPRAYVVLKPGCAAGDAMHEMLKLHVKERLAPYKYPRWIHFTETLPKTATGKIQRFMLREER